MQQVGGFMCDLRHNYVVDVTVARARLGRNVGHVFLLMGPWYLQRKKKATVSI